MATARLFKVHHTWEDWLGIALGVLIGLAPWITGETDDQIVVLNAGVIGILVLMLASLEMVGLQRWQEAAEVACGVWLMLSPFIFGYTADGALRSWHFALGFVVAVLALVELWQDWTLSDRELAQHGS